MPKGTTSSNDYLKLVYTAVAIGNIADNAAGSPLTNIYASLHSAWPGVGGDQTTNEISYTGYARVAVARSGSGWTVTSKSVSPVAQINFGQCVGGTATAMYFATGTASSSTGKLLHFGPIGTKLGRSPAAARRLGNPPEARTICDALMSSPCGAIPFALMRQHLAGGLAVSDDVVLAAMAYAFRVLKLVIEPGCAVALAAVLTGKLPFAGHTTALLVTGGNVDPETFHRALGR